MKYKVTFLDYWHLSSGLSAGSKLDSTVTRDENGLPYIPGKTIKGLIREMAELTENFDFVYSSQKTLNDSYFYFLNPQALVSTVTEATSLSSKPV